MNAPLPSSQAEILQRNERQAQVVQALREVLPTHALLWHREDTTPYECDGLTAYRERPLEVALPETYEQVQAVLRTCHAMDVPLLFPYALPGNVDRMFEPGAATSTQSPNALKLDRASF